MKYSQAYTSGILLLLIACATSSSGPGSAPSVPQPASSESPPVTKERSWLLTPDSRPQTYSSNLMTIVYQTDSPNIRQDTFTIRITFSIGQTRAADSIAWAGLITDFTAESSPMTEFGTKFLHLPLSFTGTLKNHQLQFNFNNQDQDSGSSTVCDLSSVSLATVQRLTFILPYQLTQGQTWQDSTNSTFCAGSISLTTSVLRTYRVLGTTDLPEGTLLTISENERALSKGEGSQGQHHVSLEGSTTTVRKLHVDPTSGNLISSEGTSKTLLDVRTSGKTQSFTQTVSEITKRSN